MSPKIKVDGCGNTKSDLMLNYLLYADNALPVAKTSSELQTVVIVMKDDRMQKDFQLNVKTNKIKKKE